MDGKYYQLISGLILSLSSVPVLPLLDKRTETEGFGTQLQQFGG